MLPLSYMSEILFYHYKNDIYNLWFPSSVCPTRTTGDWSGDDNTMTPICRRLRPSTRHPSRVADVPHTDRPIVRDRLRVVLSGQNDRLAKISGRSPTASGTSRNSTPSTRSFQHDHRQTIPPTMTHTTAHRPHASEPKPLIGTNNTVPEVAIDDR